MQYINNVFERTDSNGSVMYCAPVDDDDAAYLRRVAAALRPLSDEEYMNGLAYVVQTAARTSYVLEGDAIYWCIEWDPGLIVVRFLPTGAMAWTAVRSPVPDFGGRECTEADWDVYDEDGPDPQYNLIFIPWDAQFEAEKRKRRSFVPAEANVRSRFEQALTHANELGDLATRRFEAEHDAWSKRCEKNLEDWCGEGIRLN